MVPFPAITAGSLKACTNLPSTPSYVLVTNISKNFSAGTLITSAPRLSIFSSFVPGTCVGRTMVHLTPSRLAAQASPRAQFPALTVHTPSSKSFRSIDLMALQAARILNALIGCRFSSFR